MNENKDDVWCDGALFNQNVNNFPPDELAKHAGKYVAWSLDGTQILASGEDEEDVDKKLVAAGINPSRVVHSYVPAPHEHTLL